MGDGDYYKQGRGSGEGGGEGESEGEGASEGWRWVCEKQSPRDAPTNSNSGDAKPV